MITYHSLLYFNHYLDIDERNLAFAVANVQRNHMEERIHVYMNGPTLIPEGIFDFVMCNPPFYASQQDMHHRGSPVFIQYYEIPIFYPILSILSASLKASPSTSQTRASLSELVTPGGQLEFTTRLIQTSAECKTRVTWFTTLVGKKEDLEPLKACLEKLEPSVVRSTFFRQGKTVRWYLAWSWKIQGTIQD